METDLKETLCVIGRFDCPRMAHSKHILEDLNSENIQFIQCFDSEFESLRDNFLKENLQFLQCTQSPIIYLQAKEDQPKKLIGSLEELQKYLIEHYNYHDIRKTEDYVIETKEYLKKFISENGNKFVYFDFTIETSQSPKLKRVVFALYNKRCPQTVQNFLSLCVGFRNDKGETVTYKGSIINRVSQHSFIQGGDLELKGSKSVYGKEFNDENYDIQHDRPGIIGMVKKGGRNHANGCQFYITLAPLKSFDKKCVAFGVVIKGFDTIKYIGNIETGMQRPQKIIKIVDCGEYKIE